MSEENNGMNVQQTAKQRNDANNAKSIRAAAEVASKIDHPYAKAIGEGVKIADKVTGGKASEKLGKATTKILKRQGLRGKMMQAALNKMSENGTTDKINSTMNKMDSNSPGTGMPKTAKTPDKGTENKVKETAEQTSSNEGFGSVGGSTSKIVRNGLIGCAFLFPLLIFVVLFTGASQVFVNSISLGTADSLSGEEAEEKIKDKGDEGIEEEKSDADVAYDIYIDDEKILKNNIIQIASEKKYLRRKYNEATLDNIEDFYPAVKDTSKNYDENMVYDFFYKMYNLYVSYRDNYDVYLDLPLLMATLNIQSSDKNVIFSSNLSPEDRQTKARELPIEEFDYYYDWGNSGYKISRNNSQHDMELLASRMVSKQSKETCVDSAGKITQENILRDNEIGTQTLTCVEGETYKVEDLGFVVDTVKYKDFLKQFLEKKYYLEGEHDIEVETLESNNTCSTTTPFVKYSLTDDQLLQLASVAIKEQGTVKGAAAEASLMANLFEIKGSKYGTGADGLYNYVRNSGWFSNSKKAMDARKASSEVVAAVRSVLVDGKRTLPGYIDEHDWVNDIKSATTNGKAISITDRASYIKNNTILKNKYGATYTFYSFPDTKSDPFGYTSEKRRKEIGEFYYDYDTGNAVNCAKSNDPNYAEGVSFIDGGFGSNIYYYNQNDYQNYYFSKDPYNLHVHKTSSNKGKGVYQSIASSGCAPTSLAIAISTLLNEAHDPVEVTAKFCSHNGCKSSGGDYAAFPSTLAEYGLTVSNKTKDSQKVSEALSSGNSIVIVSVGKGDFTSNGHFMALTGVNSKGEVFVADPNSEKKTKWWSFSRIIEQRYWFWIVSR